jgi:hypothetical protein
MKVSAAAGAPSIRPRMFAEAARSGSTMSSTAIVQEDRSFVVKRRGRLEEYQRLAQAAFELAEQAELEHVREKHLLSAQTWQAMADAEASRG